MGVLIGLLDGRRQHSRSTISSHCGIKNVKVFPAASRVSGGEILYVMGPPAPLDVARLNLATGDTALATTIYRWYLLGRRGAEPAQKKADEAIQKKLDELLRLRR